MTQPKSSSSEFATIDSAIHSAIQDVAVGPDRGRNISMDHAALVMQGILDDAVDPVQAAALLIALRMKRESEQEMRGLTKAAQLRVKTQTVNTSHLITLVDPFDGYSRTLSVSAFIPALLAACGYPSVIHGVESVGPKFGVTVRQVLSSNPKFEVDFEEAAKQIESHGWAYLDQSDYLPELHNLIPLRNRIIKRTALTTFERVLAPIVTTGSNHLALGYVHKAYPEIYAGIAQQAGFDFIHLHKGVEGGLMIAAHKPFARYSADLRNKDVRLIKQQHGVDEHASPLRKLDSTLSVGEQARLCYQQGVDTLGGLEGPGRDALLASCANILSSVVSGLDYAQSVEKARLEIDNGSALEYFNAALKP